MAYRPALRSTIGALNDVLRLVLSIKHGTTSPRPRCRKLDSYPRQNGLASLRRELGSIERTLFILHCLRTMALRLRLPARMNKKEAQNVLASAPSSIALARSATGRTISRVQNLVTAAIVFRSTIYQERATQNLNQATRRQFLSSLGLEHIDLTRDHVWRESRVMWADIGRREASKWSRKP